MVFSGELTSAVYGPDAIPPMLALVDLPPWAGVVSVLVVPLLGELAEPVAYLGVVLPRLERRLGRSWLAAAIVVAVWAGEHAVFPLLAAGGHLDLGFAAYRVGSVLAFLAAWTAAYYALAAAAAGHGGQVGLQRRHRPRPCPGPGPMKPAPRSTARTAAGDRSWRPHHHRSGTPDHAVRKRPGEVTLDVQGEVGEAAIANQCVVAVCGQRPGRRRVVVSTLVLGSGDGAVGEARGS